MSSDKNKPNSVIYLKGDKNIINIQGQFVDLNLVVSINTSDNGKIELNLINGDCLKYFKPKLERNMKNVPKVHAYIEYDEEYIKTIISGLSKEFDYYYSSQRYHYGGFYVNKFMIYNKYESDKINKLREIEWLNLRNLVLKKWSGVGELKKFSIMDNKLVSLVREYYELNKGDSSVLRDIEAIFGFSYGDILDELPIEGDWYVGIDGDIIKID